MEIRLRHKNGNGSLYDMCEADAETYLNRSSELREETETFEANITDSIITNSFVFKARIHNSIISNSLITGPADIHNSTINCDSIAGTPSIDYSSLSGACRVWGNPAIYNVSIKDLSVFGNAALIGDWSMDGEFGRIGVGIWTRPPRVHRFNELSITLTESIPGYAYVGCRLHKLSWWFQIGDRIGKAAGWHQRFIDQTRALFHEWNSSPYLLAQTQESFLNLES